MGESDQARRPPADAETGRARALAVRAGTRGIPRRNTVRNETRDRNIHKRGARALSPTLERDQESTDREREGKCRDRPGAHQGDRQGPPSSRPPVPKDLRPPAGMTACRRADATLRGQQDSQKGAAPRGNIPDYTKRRKDRRGPLSRCTPPTGVGAPNAGDRRIANRTEGG